MGLVLLDLLTQLGEKGQANAVIFVGAVVDDAVLIYVKHGAEQEFGPVEGISEIGHIGKVAVRHANNVVDVQGRLSRNFRAPAVIKILFIGIEVAGRGIRKKTGLVGRGVEVAPQEGVIRGREA